MLPDPKYLTGDFGGLTDANGKPLILKDPLNNNVPFINNRIPAERIAKIAQNFNKYIPAPNTNLAQGNYTGNPSTLDDFDQYHIRIDHRFSDSDSMFGRYSRSTWDILNQGLLPFSGSAFPLNSQSGVIQETHIFGPRAVNTLKLGVNRDVVANSNEVADQNLAEQIGFKNLSVASYDYSLPRFNITGFTQMGHSQQTFHQWTNAYILSDTFVLVRGLHNITFGGDVRAYRSPTSTTNGTNGRITVSNIFTGYSLADYLLGAYQTASVYDSFSTGDFRNSQYALFVQDDYKILPRLTLNLGLRWEYNTPWRELGGSEGFFDQTAGVLRVANSPNILGLNFPATPTLVVGGVREGVFPPRLPAIRAAHRFGLQAKRQDRNPFRLRNLLSDQPGQPYHRNQLNPGSAITITTTNSAGKTPRLVDTLFDTPAQALFLPAIAPVRWTRPGSRPTCRSGI